MPLAARRCCGDRRRPRQGSACQLSFDPLAAPDRSLPGNACGLVELGCRQRHRHGDPELARGPDSAPADVRARAEPRQGQTAPDHAGRGRRLRAEVPDLRRVEPDRLGDPQARAGPALDRRARRARSVGQPFARSRGIGRIGARCCRQVHRPARARTGEFRCLPVDVRAVDPDHRSRQGDLRSLPHPRD